MQKQTYKYIDVLHKIVDSYNHTPHQSLGGAAPSYVNKDNEDEIRYVQYLVRRKNNMRFTLKNIKKNKHFFLNLR